MSVVSLHSLTLLCCLAHGFGLRAASLRISFIERSVPDSMDERTGKKLRGRNDVEGEERLQWDILGDGGMLDSKGSPLSCNGRPATDAVWHSMAPSQCLRTSPWASKEGLAHAWALDL